MPLEFVDRDKIRTYSDGRFHFFVGLCEKMGLPQLFNQHMKKTTGRPMDLPPGIEAMILMAPMAEEGYKPLYQLHDYYHTKDLEGMFHYPVQEEHIKDDRFGYFLDAFYAAGCRQIFSEICTNALLTYGIQIQNINYDTTSFVMWGEYKTVEGKTGAISIDFGHSKARRSDKKQFKMAIGTADGTIVDAKVLSGNHSDKTFNKENIVDTEKVLSRLGIDKDTFHSIADSAFFAKETLDEAKAKGILWITRIPDNVKIAKALIEQGVGENGKPVLYRNAHNKDVKYVVEESRATYEGHTLNCAAVYSTALEPAKRKSSEVKVQKEKDILDRVRKDLQKRNFSCKEDAERELEVLQQDKKRLKSAFHNTTLSLTFEEKNTQGRPSLDPTQRRIKTEYHIEMISQRDEDKINEHIRKECIFVLASNNPKLSAEAILLEYKTQSGVEKRFQQLKDPHFINSLYLEKPERIEALAYLILLTMMILSVMEQVVRKGLKEENETIVATGKKINKQPTQMMILRLFYNIVIQTYVREGKMIRYLLKPLNDSQAKVIRYLGIPESVFAWNGT